MAGKCKEHSRQGWIEKSASRAFRLPDMSSGGEEIGQQRWTANRGRDDTVMWFAPFLPFSFALTLCGLEESASPPPVVSKYSTFMSLSAIS